MLERLEDLPNSSWGNNFYIQGGKTSYHTKSLMNPGRTSLSHWAFLFFFRTKKCKKRAIFTTIDFFLQKNNVHLGIFFYNRDNGLGIITNFYKINRI
jgi:hypothetical protein